MKYGNKSQFRRSGAAEKLKGQPNLQEKKLVKVYFNGPAADGCPINPYLCLGKSPEGNQDFVANYFR